MIGLKIQNRLWQTALIDLYPNQMEIFQANKTYRAILTINNTQDLPKSTVPIIDLAQVLSFPIQKSDLDQLIQQYVEPAYENTIFKWDMAHRQLIHKKTKKIITLTQKESELIDYLTTCPKGYATREEIIQKVWHYTPDAETHTLESHIYTLRQKLSTDADQLIVQKEGGYQLV